MDSSSPSHPLSLQRRRILVVDDDRLNVRILGGILRPEGYTLAEANTGERALEVLTEFKTPSRPARCRHARHRRLRNVPPPQGEVRGARDKLCKDFSQPSVKPTAGEKSTGLGLAICRKIVEAHGGAIAADSLAPGECEFRVTLPSHQ